MELNEYWKTHRWVFQMQSVELCLCFLCIKFLHQKYFLTYMSHLWHWGEGCNILLLFFLFLPFHRKYAPLVADCHVLRSSAVSQFFSSFSPLRVCQTQITTMSSADCWPDWKAITSWESWWRWRTTLRSSDSLPTSPWPACRYKMVLVTLNGCLCPLSSLETKWQPSCLFFAP